MPSPGPVAGRKCLVWTSLWLGPLLLVWGGFIVVSHQPGLGAITWERWLFGWLVLQSYVMVWGWVVGMTPQPPLTLFRAIACTFALAGILLCLELPRPEAVRAGGMPYPPVDTHWSPTGHALVAERLALELQQRAWLTPAQPA